MAQGPGGADPTTLPANLGSWITGTPRIIPGQNQVKGISTPHSHGVKGEKLKGLKRQSRAWVKGCRSPAVEGSTQLGGQSLSRHGPQGAQRPWQYSPVSVLSSMGSDLRLLLCVQEARTGWHPEPTQLHLKQAQPRRLWGLPSGRPELEPRGFMAGVRPAWATDPCRTCPVPP